MSHGESPLGTPHALARLASPLFGAVLLMACSPAPPAGAPLNAETSAVQQRAVDTSDWSLNVRAAPDGPELSGYASSPNRAVVTAVEDHNATKYGANEVFVSAQCLDAAGLPTIPSGYVSGAQTQPTMQGPCYYGYTQQAPPYAYVCYYYGSVSAPATVSLTVDCPDDAVAVSATANNNEMTSTTTVPLPADNPPFIFDKYATPNPVEAGGTAVLSLFADDDVDISSYTLDCDSDGTPEVTVDVPGTDDTTLAATESCTYPTPGMITATFEVTDRRGQTDAGTVDVEVVDTTPPTVDLGGPYTANPGADFSVDLETTDAVGLASYELDCGDGTVSSGMFTPGSTTDTRVETCSLATSGDYVATFTSTDAAGNVAEVSAAVHVNFAPVAGATVATVNEGEPVGVDAAGSSDQDGSIVLFELDCDGDGLYEQSSVTSPSFICPAFGDQGPYSGSLQVTDDGGLNATSALTFAPVNAIPLADAGLEQRGAYTTAFTFAGTFTDAGADDTHTFEWDFGDGTVTSGSLQASHTYATPGVYTATLTVTDDDGGVGQSMVQIAAVDSVSPCDVLVSEVMANPLDSATRQWIEVHNPTSAEIDLVGMVLSDATGSTTIGSSVVVPAGGYATLCRDADDAGFTCDHVYDTLVFATPTIEEVTLTAADVVITTATFDVPAQGESVASVCNDACDPATGVTTDLLDQSTDTSYGLGGNGTPGDAHDDDLDGDGASVCGLDCDDTDPDNHPGNPELCDGQDNDCSGVADDGPDADDDGVADVCDTCAGDDLLDTDADGTPDDCDACPLDAPDDDDDDDGVCDSDDVCLGGDDAVDGDDDGMPDACDDCPDDALDDSDGDGVCDSDDLCEGDDDTLDTDGDAVPDCLDPCPDDVDDLCDEVDTGDTGDTGDAPIPATPPTVVEDADGDGYTVAEGDCDDDDRAINPGAEEVPNDGVDSDCDGGEAPGQCSCSSRGGGLGGVLSFGLVAFLVRRRSG